MSIPYTPDLAGAAQDAFAGQAFDDPGSSAYAAADPARVDAKYFLKPVQDELLALHAGRVASASYRQTWTCASGLNAGDPVYVSANDTVTLADATTNTKAQVIGFVRYKPTTTTCYIEHFRYVSGLSGGTAGGKVYLTDAGGFSASAGTVEKVVGQWITATEALLHASQLTALGGGISGGTASFVPKFASASALGLSAYGDDGTYGVLFKVGSSSVSDPNSLLKWRGATVPAAFLASSGSGESILFRAQDAASGGGGNGADVIFMPGAKDGAGSDGYVKVRRPGSTNEVRIWATSAGGHIDANSDFLYLDAGYVLSKNFNPQAAGTYYFGDYASDFLVAAFRNIQRASGQTLNFLASGSGVSDANTICKLHESAPSAFAAAADTNGKHCYFRAQSGGAHSAAHPDGGDFRFILGAAGSGGIGSDGRFKIYDASISQSFRFLFSGGDGTLALDSGDFYLVSDSGDICFGTHGAIGAETVTGYITIKDSAGNTRKLAVVS